LLCSTAYNESLHGSEFDLHTIELLSYGPYILIFGSSRLRRSRSPREVRPCSGCWVVFRCRKESATGKTGEFAGEFIGLQVTAKQLAIQVGKEMSEKGAYRLRTAEVIGATSERLACAKLLKSERRFCEPSGPLRTILSLFILSAVRIFRRNVCDIPFRIASSDPFRSMQMVAVTSC
jgi:hypothetical protein